jgi:hypothetical protein
MARAAVVALLVLQCCNNATLAAARPLLDAAAGGGGAWLGLGAAGTLQIMQQVLDKGSPSTPCPNPKNAQAPHPPPGCS